MMFGRKQKEERHPTGTFDVTRAIANGSGFRQLEGLLPQGVVTMGLAYPMTKSGGAPTWALVAAARVQRVRVVDGRNFFATREVVECRCSTWSTRVLKAQLENLVTHYGHQISCSDDETRTFVRKATGVSPIPIYTTGGPGGGAMPEQIQAFTLLELDGQMGEWIVGQDSREFKALVSEAEAYDSRQPPGPRLLAWAFAAAAMSKTAGMTSKLDLRSR